MAKKTTGKSTAAEKAIKEEVSIPGKDGAKARKIAAYRLAD